MMNPLKIYLNEIKEMGYFLDFRPYSISSLSKVLSEFVGGSQNLNIGKNGVSVIIKKLLKWKAVFGEKIEVTGKMNQDDFLNFIGGVSVWKKMMDKVIYEDIKKYPIDGLHAWCTYMESKKFGFFYLKNLLSPKYKYENGAFKKGNKRFHIKDGVEKWDKRAYDFTGRFKLGGAFVSSFDKDKITDDKEFFEDILKSISFFFKKKDEFERGNLKGNVIDIGKFRANVLNLAKKRDIVAQRVYTTILDERPIKSLDFNYLNNKIKTNVTLKVAGEKYTYKDI